MIRHILPHALSGVVQAPPSKSYAHRWLLAAYLSGDDVCLQGVGTSQDVAATLGALTALGLTAKAEGDTLRLGHGDVPDRATVDCRESGSTLRFLLPVAAARGIRCTFTGAPSLLSRPITGLVDALNAHGADIRDLTVHGRLAAGDYYVDAGVSSQYVTGLMYALPLLDGDSRLHLVGPSVSRRYIDITRDVLTRCGIRIEDTADGYAIAGRQAFRLPARVTVEGDWSGAAFWLTAGALSAEGVTVRGLTLDSHQGDRAILDVLGAMGARIECAGDAVTVRKHMLSGTQIDVDVIPDLAQILSVAAAFCVGQTTLCHVHRLQMKESDRLGAILATLGAVGIECRHAEDNLIIEGGLPTGSTIAGGNDHRTVMSAAILAAYCTGESDISDAEAVAKSYPAFWQDYATLGGKDHGCLSR